MSLRKMIYQQTKAAINALTDLLDEYQSIGTVQECRAAVEKQRAKKHIIEWKCPVCGTNYIELTPCGDWCRYCGTKLDWGNENDKK